MSQWRWRGGQGAAVPPQDPRRADKSGQCRAGREGGLQPNLLLAGGTGLARRGTAAGIFSPGSPLQVRTVPSCACSVRPCSCGVSAPVQPFPFPLWHLQLLKAESLGFPVPSHHRALLQGCSAPSRPPLALAAAAPAPSPSFRGCPRRTFRLLGSLSGRIPLPRVASARVAAEPGGDGVIRDAAPGMRRGRDTAPAGRCYRQRLQLQRLPQPAGPAAVLRDRGSLPAGFPPFSRRFHHVLTELG